MTDSKHPSLNKPEQTWCPWNPDEGYSGAGQVVKAELNYIQSRRSDASPDNLTGLALSGGGIRSATFSLGVMQALAKKGWLKKFDYLSTVSGGGYIGSSLTWLLHKKWQYLDKNFQNQTVKFGLDETNFPYKTEPVWSEDITESGQAITSQDTVSNTVKGSLLRWLRQHAKFLTPGGTHTFMTLIAVVFRSSLLNLLFYFAIAILMFMALNQIGFFNKANWLFENARNGLPRPLIAAGWSGILFVISSLFYSFMTTFKKHSNSDLSPNWKTNRYFWRRATERWLNIILSMSIGLALVGILPLIPDMLRDLKMNDPDGMSNMMGALSTLAGILSSIGVFAKSNSRKTPKYMNILVIVAATLLVFGFLFFSYRLAAHVIPKLEGAWFYTAMVILGLLSIGAYFNNLNYISVHRYYRDRLMETFMPDVGNAIKTDNNDTNATPEANLLRIHNVCDGQPNECGPYHIINTNIVLTNSRRPKFKGRGGDNFIMSPLYCGSNATGWRYSGEFMRGEMTLATAMAISGAAVNPKTGCGGEGVTRNLVLSALMGLLNIRLGYWATNPDPERKTAIHYPNIIWPGLGELFLNKHLDEKSRFIQLSDGGHFENLAIYELIRRKLKLIVVCDGGADPDYTFTDLANAIEKVRADFGVLIKVNGDHLDDLISRKKNADDPDDGTHSFAQRGYLIADIHYPGESHGTLIYLTTTFTEGLSADLYGYRKEHPEFPDEPTSDQFFDEKQFEAYRELGFQLAWKMLQDPKIKSDMSMIISEPS